MSNHELSRVSGMNTVRLEGAINLDCMTSSHVVGIGVGGAAGLYENLVRSGLGKLTVVDFDTVDASNLCTQGFYINDIGIPKVEALGRRLTGINPNLEYVAVSSDFTKLSEEEVKNLIHNANLIMLMTDSFYAQARGNRVALKYQIPAIFAIVYANARCAEITFTIPGITPACHRCAVSSRYQAYKTGYSNDVTSTGSTVFHTHYLNSCLGLLTLAMLHQNLPNTEFSNWFGERWERNLVQVRMHPQYGKQEGSLFEKTFRGQQRIFAFDSLWQFIEPEYPPKYEKCPDCGGVGDLRMVQVDVTNVI